MKIKYQIFYVTNYGIVTLDPTAMDLFFDTVEDGFQCMKTWLKEDKPRAGTYTILPVMIFE